MLSLYYSMCELWPHLDNGRPDSTATAACLQPAPAVVQLVLAAFDAVHALQQRHQQQQQLGQGRQDPIGRVQRFQPSSGQGTMFMAIAAQLVLGAMIRAHLADLEDMQLLLSSEMRELSCSPDVHRCLTLNACVAVMALAESSSSNNSKDGGGGDSGSRRGGSSSSSRSGSSSQQAKAQTHQQNQQGSCSSSRADAGGWNCPVSPLTDRLFELVGVDRATLQYAARMAPPVSCDNVLQVAQVISSLFWLNEVSYM